MTLWSPHAQKPLNGFLSYQEKSSKSSVRSVRFCVTWPLAKSLLLIFYHSLPHSLCCHSTIFLAVYGTSQAHACIRAWALTVPSAWKYLSSSNHMVCSQVLLQRYTLREIFPNPFILIDFFLTIYPFNCFILLPRTYNLLTYYLLVCLLSFNPKRI